MGHHTLGDISNHAMIATSHLSAYLQRLQDLKLVERRLPAATLPAKRRSSRLGRYHLADPYFRFYFRFIAPHYEYLPFATERVLERIRQELRGFVGGTAFEDLARQWVIERGAVGELPVRPEIVGAHWSRKVQIDVAAIDWTNRQVLVGECKWGDGRIEPQVVRELVEHKGELLRRELPNGETWRFHYALFSRAGLSRAAAAELAKHDGFHGDLARLDADLS